MPNTPKSFWRAVEASCAEDTDLAGHGFVENFEAYFLRPGKRGTSYALRQRVVETHMVQQSLGWAETVFKLIGPSQVGLGALAGMRLLHQLKKALGSKVAIWPFEAPEAPLVVVEAFPRAYIRMAGLGQRKLRNRADLKVALAHFDAKARTLPKDLTDDMCDALVTAAALRSLSRDSHVWRPKTLSARVRATEGWVFGVS